MADDKVLPRACLALKEDRLSVYMNLAGIAFLRDRPERLVQSDPAGHFEIHLSDEREGERNFDQSLAARAWARVPPGLGPRAARRRTGILDGEGIEYLPFDLNSMMISGSELDEVATLEESGILPDIVGEESS